jgi:hypothetical protein
VLIAGLVVAIAVEGSYTDQRIDALKKSEGEEDQVLEEILNRSTQIRETLSEFNRTQWEQYEEFTKALQEQQSKIGKMETRIRNLEENQTDDWETLQ